MKKSVFVLLMSMLMLIVGVGQAQEAALTEVYQSAYFHLQFDYPAGWFIVENSGGVQLLNYDYDNSGPNAPGEARMQFATDASLLGQGLNFDHADPVLFLNALRLVFNSGENTQSPAEAITLGDRAAARADGIFLNNQTVYLGFASESGDMLFISGEAAPDDFAAFEPLFLQIAATAHYTPPTFADPLPPITADNAAQVARYLEFVSTRLPGGQTDQVAFSADGRLAANVLGFDGVQLWDAITGDFLYTLNIHANEAAFSPDGSYLVAVDFSDGLQTYDFDSHEVTAVPSDDNLRTVAYSADGAWIATGGNSGAVRLWDAETHEIGQTLVDLDRVQIKAVRFSPDGTQLAATYTPAVLLSGKLAANRSQLCLLLARNQRGRRKHWLTAWMEHGWQCLDSMGFMLCLTPPVVK